jgi:iron complex outermembrane receptor protein
MHFDTAIRHLSARRATARARFRPLFAILPLAAALAELPVPARAQDAPPAASPTVPAADQRVVVTGSNVRRTDVETPSPVQVLTAADIKRSGYTSVADVLHNITANNMGSLTQAAPSAFAAGGSGISLRGLTVGATLVLIDGHRMASYPMPDDGERDFVDIASIPIDTIERIEVLKDGASAVYGSDAIAGVVNVILKHKLVGTTVSAEAGVTAKGDGKTEHASITTGWGDLDSDGHNTYVSLEARHQDAILLRNRPYLAITDWSKYGGVNLTQGTNSGTVSGASSGAGSGTGYLTDPNGSDNPATNSYFPGCSATAAANDTCGYTNPYQTLQPKTSNVDLMGRYTLRLNDDWSTNFQGSVLRSDAMQVGLYNNAYATGVGSGANGGGLNLFHFGPGSPPTPAFPDQFPFVLTVPANYPGNTYGTDAPLVYDFPDLGPLTQKTQSTSYRGVAELNGSLGAWDVNAALGVTRVTTTASFYHYIDFPALQSALDSLTYQVGGTNSPDVLSAIAPSAQSTSSNDLSFVSVRGTRDLMTLPGGPLSIGTGAEFTHRQLHELFPASFVNGDQSIGIYSFAEGKQSITAAYAELVAPLRKNFEIDAAGRVDHYDTYGTSATPKLGFKFEPTQAFTLRGTFSKGFRAPNPAEIGDAGSTSGYVGGLYDPVQCPGGPLNTTSNPPNNPNPSCVIALQELQLSAPHLKPEKSTSFTLGTIYEPSKDFNGTLDYYHITIRDQIISVGQLGQQGLNNAAQLGTTIYRDADGNILYDTYPFINANTTTTSGLDVNLRSNFNLHDAGRLKADLEITYMLQYDLTAQGVTYHLAGTHGPAFVSEDTGTPRTRGAFTLTWDRGPMELTGTVNYINSYGVTDPSEGIPDCATALNAEFPNGSPPSRFCKVPAFVEFNLTGSYEVDKHWKLHAGVINLFNRHAPYDLQTFGSAGNGATQGGAPYNPSLAQDGAVGPLITVGGVYTF